MRLADLAGRELDVEGARVTLDVRPHKHIPGAVVVAAMKDDGGELGTISVSAWAISLADDELLAKTSPQNEALITAARATGWFEVTERTLPLGFCLAEVWRLVR